MTLKRQLLLLGLLTLALPWLAVNYIQRLDETLRQSRLETVEELAASLARSLSKEEFLLARMAQRNQQTPAIFAASLPNDHLLDGYLTEWQGAEFADVVDRYGVGAGWAPLLGLPSGASASIRVGLTEGEGKEALWLAMAIKGLKPHFYSPQKDAFDAVILHFSGGISLRITSAVAGDAVLEHWDNGFWRRHFDGAAYWQLPVGAANRQTLELSLPAHYRERSFTLEYYSVELGYSVFLSAQNTPQYFAYNEPQFLAAAGDFASEQQKVSLYDGRGLPLASAGGLALGAGLPEFNERRSWMMRLYFLLSGRAELSYQSPKVPMGDERTAWFFNRVSPVARAVVPIGDPLSPAGWLVLDKQDADFYVLLAGIYGQFVFICAIFAVFIVVTLLGFSSVHSWRIRSLAKQAEQAVDVTGNLRASFRASRIPDEIGQLSRSFETLFCRLATQQEYLKSLAVKLSHELRTPLAITQSSLDNLEALALTPPQLTYVARARQGMARLASTLNAMSAVNSLEQALMQAERETFCIRDMLQSLVAAYQDNYAQPIVLSGLEADAQACMVVAAPELIVQMLDKLVENASQFSSGSSRIILKVERPSLGDLRLSVVNTGQPLPKGMEQQLFDSMVSSRAQSNSDGDVHLGLGLYIARLICEFHGGTIRAYSAASDRSDRAVVTFEVNLPIIAEI